MKKKKWGWIASLLLFYVLSFVYTQQSVAAATAQTATLRIVSTTDLHGKVSKMYYDTGVEKNGGLAQDVTLIEKAKEEVGASNALTVDIGDSMYGYSADYVLNHSQSDTVQPVYKAMAAVGYDAITLGNHDFDYGFPYLKQQLELSGLADKCVLSNVVYADTGQTVWNETKIITKQLKTNKGKNVDVKIGLIGVTRPSLSTISECKDDIAALSVIQTVRKKAENLRAEGADVVAVLAHCGMGKVKALDTDEDALYYLANSVEEIDAVVGGHRHVNFPAYNEENANVYKRDNVDAETGLINGKPLTIVKDHGAGIGVIDLKLKIKANGTVKVSGACAEVRLVQKDTVSSQKILDAQQAEIQPVDKSLEQMIGALPENEKVDSYFALIEDNYAIQLANEARIAYGLSFTGGAGKSLYGDYPVIALTNYGLNGSQSAADQIDINGTVTMHDILTMQMAGHAYDTLFWITGSQLREWLEWSASIYSTSDTKITSDEILGKLLEERGAATIAAADWMDDWGEFGVCDGVGYTIDATQLPRYSKKGTLLNADSHRIVSLTYDGLPVADDQKFIIVVSGIPSGDATAGISEQKVFGEKKKAYEELREYVAEQQKFGNLDPAADNNWNVVFSSNMDYIVRSSIFSQQQAYVKDWFRELAGYNDTFAYYMAQFIRGNVQEDNDKPLLVISSTQREEYDEPFAIKVQASDASGIKTVKWLPGKQAADSEFWQTASEVVGGEVIADSNQIYSVLAEDNAGNQSIKYIEITNLNSSVLPAPTIKKVTNHSAALKGTSRYGTTVYIQAGDNTYETETLPDGTYTCTAERLDAGVEVRAYCRDAAGRTSAETTATVIKRGPNLPLIKKLSNTAKKVTGTYADQASAIVAVIGSRVYCSGEEGKVIYEQSDIYNAEKTVVPVDYEQDGKAFSLALPIQNAGKKVNFYALDKAGRRSKKLSAVTADMGPNMPKVEQVCSIEDYIYGSVTNVCESGMAIVTVNGEEYVGEVQEDGTFAVQADTFKPGRTVKVKVQDVKDGIERESLSVSTQVLPYTNYVHPSDDQTYLDEIYDDMTEIIGYAPVGSNTKLSLDGVSEQVEIDESGEFCFELDGPLEKDTSVYLITRSGSRIHGIIEQKVLNSVPGAPVLLDPDVTTKSKTIRVFTVDTGTVEMKINGKLYASKKKGVYNSEYGGYVYQFKLPKAKKAQKLSFRMISKRGVPSKNLNMKRTKYVKKSSKSK